MRPRSSKHRRVCSAGSATCGRELIGFGPTGVDRGRGGKFLLPPPDYQGQAPAGFFSEKSPRGWFTYVRFYSPTEAFSTRPGSRTTSSRRNDAVLRDARVALSRTLQSVSFSPSSGCGSPGDSCRCCSRLCPACRPCRMNNTGRCTGTTRRDPRAFSRSVRLGRTWKIGPSGLRATPPADTSCA
jgi:hypothetical protein